MSLMSKKTKVEFITDYNLHIIVIVSMNITRVYLIKCGTKK